MSGQEVKRKHKPASERKERSQHEKARAKEYQQEQRDINNPKTKRCILPLCHRLAKNNRADYCSDCQLLRIGKHPPPSCSELPCTHDPPRNRQCVDSNDRVGCNLIIPCSGFDNLLSPICSSCSKLRKVTTKLLYICSTCTKKTITPKEYQDNLGLEILPTKMVCKQCITVKICKECVPKVTPEECKFCPDCNKPTLNQSKKRKREEPIEGQDKVAKRNTPMCKKCEALLPNNHNYASHGSVCASCGSKASSASRRLRKLSTIRKCSLVQCQAPFDMAMRTKRSKLCDTCMVEYADKSKYKPCKSAICTHTPCADRECNVCKITKSCQKFKTISASKCNVCVSTLAKHNAAAK